MQNQSKHYEFSFGGGANSSYYFSTANDIRYEIKFVPSNDFFDGYATLSIDVFEMIISVADNPTRGRLQADPLVAPTIFSIFESSFWPIDT